ncbi:MAG TPA: biopolymer transporter ExbD [Kofleriaceae bacterium]|nr:biopolymer transporter ExbD [Kofleriaceae bacterium]
MNAAQVRAKARMAMKRREEEVEQDEIESGEINLVPYLDIVTNLMLFLLVSVSAGFILGQINTTLPDHVPADQVQATNPQTPPDEKPLQLIVSATKQGILLWSISGLEGTLENPKARIARRAATAADEAPHYDYAGLNAALYEIATRRWKGKARGPDTYEIILQADPDIPYESVVAIMDAVRRRIPPDSRPGQKLPEVTLPLKKEGDKVVPTENYDPDKHYLFPDVLFGKWSFD